MAERKGLIIVHTGNGKGKTTAALGLALRAVGCGFRVAMIQFIKGKWKYGERDSAPRIGLELIPMGQGFTWESKDIEVDKAMMRAAWEECKVRAHSGNYDLLIFDEINYVLGYGYLPVEEVVEVLRAKPPSLHIVLTGRNARPEIIEIADLVTEMKEIKHPFKKGIKAQRGIEF
ncbi:MAG: cob(I)yrinic acid a,c-diamide adenosyltransferase [Terriglobia bacterium]